jgi:choice-of-anchor B domain-containing protein
MTNAERNHICSAFFQSFFSLEIFIKFSRHFSEPIHAKIIMLKFFSPMLALFCLQTSFIFSQTNGVTLFSHLDKKHGTTNGVSYSGCWGWTHSNGKEYGIVGTATGTAFIDITDSANEVAFVTGPTSVWREMRTYKNYAYVVTEAGGGVQIIDLTNLPSSVTFVQSFNYTNGSKNILRSHTIEISDGYMYLNGCANWSPGAAVIFSLINPMSPQFVGEVNFGRYYHDTYIRNDTMYAAAAYNGIDIINLTNKTSPSLIAHISEASFYKHNTWTTTNGNYLISTDEIGSTPLQMKFWNMTTLPAAPTSPSATYSYSPSDIVHNVTVRGNFAYVAWYTAGTIVVDISEPLNPQTAGSYDSYPGASGGYNGVWAIYPYFPSGKIVSSDIQTGTYVFTFSNLFPRRDVHLMFPNDNDSIVVGSPVEFRWKSAANNSDDPHYYQLYIFGNSLDTMFRANDSTLALTLSFLPAGNNYQWSIVTKDEFNTTASTDTFSLRIIPQTFGSVSGIVFNDSNGDGIKNNGETGLVNWKIKITGTKNDSAISDANGNYFIGNLPDGNYTLSEVLPNEFVQTIPSSPGTYFLSISFGNSITGKHFGNFKLGKIGGQKFHDANGNGTKDAGENGIPNWKIFLNGVANDSVITDVNGNFLFTHLFAGTYTVSEENRNEWLQTFPVSGIHLVTVFSGAYLSGNNFGNYRYGKISGMKFNDVNANGIFDENENGIPNWKLFLLGAAMDSVSTDANGTYIFTNVHAGAYTLSEMQNVHWVQTFPSSGTYSGSVSSGDSIAGKNFGNVQTGKISGTIFSDNNGNGVFDDEEPKLSSWKIRLKKNSLLVDSALSDAKGMYEFSNLLPAEYEVSEAVFNGWIQTFPQSGKHLVSLFGGNIVENKNFGNFQQCSISGMVFEDENGNGVRNVGDGSLQGIKILLFSPDTLSLVDSVQMMDEGYAFTNLFAGTYVVRIKVGEGWKSTTANPSAITLTSGTNVGGIHFGLFLLGKISGNIFFDGNANAIRDSAETNLPFWKIMLEGVSDDTVETDENGNYFFENLEAGNYVVREKLLGGWQRTFPLSEMHSVTITSGSNVSGNNFGNYTGTTTFRTFRADTLLSQKAVKIKKTKYGTFVALPNIATVRDNAFIKIGRGGATFLGVPQVTKDSARFYSWIYFRAGTSLGKFYTEPHTGNSYPLDTARIMGSRFTKKLSKSFTPTRTKYNNVAWEQGVVMKLNLFASRDSVLPSNFGSLVLDTPYVLAGRQLKGNTLSEIANYFDTLMTYWERFGMNNSTAYSNIDTFARTIVKRINDGFFAQIDSGNVSIQYVQKKRYYAVSLKGVKTASELGIVREEPNRISAPLIFSSKEKSEPTEIVLEQNYPNPFNPTTAIGFSLLAVGEVTLKIYNVLGQEVATLLNNETMEEGEHEVEFDASNLPSGVYFYTIQTEGLTISRKLIFLK